MFLRFLSEEEVKDVVVEIICREIAIERAERQFLNSVWQFAVGVTVDDRYLIPLGARVWPIISVVRP
jgi:hypothetical protein